MTASGERLDAMVLLGPEVESDGLVRARERSRRWLGVRRPGVLSLLAVEPVAGRVGWVYQPFDGVSLGALRRALPELPSQRVAAEIVIRCAQISEVLWADGELHPGIDLDDVLIGPDGRVVLAGFVGPFAQSPIHRDPRGTEDSAAAVWRLGVLLAQLLTGAPPTTATDRVSHELMLRRLLIRIMSRPGPGFPERYRDWQCAMLAFSPEDRPILARIAPGLHEIAETLPEPSLASWAQRWVPEIRERPTPGEPPLLPSDSLEPTEIGGAHPSEHTEEAEISEYPQQDDATAISTDGDPPRPFASPEHGAVPVHVGPPPEAVPKITALPEELFGNPLVQTDPDTPAGVSAPRPSSDRSRRRLAILFGAALVLVALVLFWYILI